MLELVDPDFYWSTADAKSSCYCYGYARILDFVSREDEIGQINDEFANLVFMARVILVRYSTTTGWLSKKRPNILPVWSLMSPSMTAQVFATDSAVIRARY